MLRPPRQSSGRRGLGKTFVLREVDKCLRESGRDVAHCAPTASAVDASATMNNDYDVWNTPTRTPCRRFGCDCGRFRADLAPRRFCDSAPCAATRHWRVVFTGDVRQHTSVDAGDFLRLLETHAGVHRVELTEIRRQTDLAYREAIRDMSAGAVSSGLLRLDGLGWVKEGGPDYLQNAASEYARATLDQANPASVICVAPTWAENHLPFHGAIRTNSRKAVRSVQVRRCACWNHRGHLRRSAGVALSSGLVVTQCNSGYFRKGEMATVLSSDESEVIVRSHRSGARRLSLSRGNFEVCSTREIEVAHGDKLLLRANDKAQGLINGRIVEVKSVEGGIVHTDDGLKIDSARYARFTHRYVATSHRARE